MKSIREMEADAARYAAMSSEDQAAYDAELENSREGFDRLAVAAEAITESACAGENIAPLAFTKAWAVVATDHAQTLQGARALMMVEAMDAVKSMVDAGVDRALAIRLTSVEAFYTGCFLTMCFKRLAKDDAYSPARIALYVHDMAVEASKLSDQAEALELIGEDQAIGRAAEMGANLAAELAQRKATDAVLDQLRNERNRHLDVEGWTLEHDDQHADGEMARAAGVYASFASNAETFAAAQRFPEIGRAPASWPWSLSWFKPGPTARRMLVKAATLLVAEIERIDRKAARP